MRGCCLPGRDQASGPMQQVVCRLRRVIVSRGWVEAMADMVWGWEERESGGRWMNSECVWWMNLFYDVWRSI